MAATPLRPGDIAAGVALWHATRAALTAGGVAVVLALVRRRPGRGGCWLAVPFGVLTGLAFSMPITAWSSTRETASSRSRRSCASSSCRCSCSPAPSTRSTSCPTGCSRSPTSRRCGTASSCAAAPCSARSASARRVVHVAVLAAFALVGFAHLPPHVRQAAGDMTATMLTRATGGLRIIPPELLAARRPHRMLERAVMVNRRTWLIIVSGFFEPLFYLLSIRIGFGELVGDVTVGGQHDPVRRVRRAGADGGVGDERRRVRLDDERLLQAEARQALRRGAGDAAGARRRRARRDRLGRRAAASSTRSPSS